MENKDLLVQHSIGDGVVYQRETDGYVNATAMCKASGKQFHDYSRLVTTKEFVNEVSSIKGIPVNGLIQSVTGSFSETTGSWVHPNIAIHLAQWCSPKFAVKVTQLVMDWNNNQRLSNLPYYLRRVTINSRNIKTGYFSILNEMSIFLISPLEDVGFILPDSMMPDIATGKMVSNFLRNKGYEVDNMPFYWHQFEDGRRVKARAYPEQLVGTVRKYIREEWFCKKAFAYFYKRAPEAIPYLKKVLLLPSFKEIGAITYHDAESKALSSSAGKTGHPSMGEVRSFIKRGSSYYNEEVIIASHLFADLVAEYPDLGWVLKDRYKKSSVMKRLGYHVIQRNLRLAGKSVRIWGKKKMTNQEIRNSLSGLSKNSGLF